MARTNGLWMAIMVRPPGSRTTLSSWPSLAGGGGGGASPGSMPAGKSPPLPPWPPPPPLLSSSESGTEKAGSGGRSWDCTTTMEVITPRPEKSWTGMVWGEATALHRHEHRRVVDTVRHTKIDTDGASEWHNGDNDGGSRPIFEGKIFNI